MAKKTAAPAINKSAATRDWLAANPNQEITAAALADLLTAKHPGTTFKVFDINNVKLAMKKKAGTPGRTPPRKKAPAATTVETTGTQSDTIIELVRLVGVVGIGKAESIINLLK